MKKAILICLCSVIMLVTLSIPVYARVLVGLSPVAPLSEIDQHTLNELSTKFEALTGTEVSLRSFDNDAAIINWLMRFQEIDAAIVSQSFISQQPAGALKHLADLHANDSSFPPLALVTRNNLSGDQANQLQKAFLHTDESDSGHKLFATLGLAGVSMPGEPLKRRAPKPAPLPPQPLKQEPSPAVRAEQTEKVRPTQGEEVVPPQKPAQKSAVSVQDEKPLKNETSSLSQTAVSIAAKAPDKPAPGKKEQPEMAARVQDKTEPELKSPVKPVKTNEQTVEPQVSKQEKPLSKQDNRTETAAQKAAPSKRWLIFVALLLLLAILLKVSLFILRWQNRRKSTFEPEEAPTSDIMLNHVAPPAPAAAPAMTSNSEKVVIEAGRLGPGKVPALLKQCADMPEPVILSVTKGSCEKLVHFAGGQVSSALTQNSSASASGVRWDKLGSLLVREELVTSEERDRGMALISEEPGLRLGEALLKLGLIDLSGLRQALTRQAKVTIYSLILFPEGRYQIFACDGSLPPEESVSLEITNLIREASHHKSEWTAIRQALPNLNTALNFTPEGRIKLEKVGLSPQQEATLSLIDGQATINDICIGSSMMDYEVYRFLYLMVKAGVLR